MSKERIEELEDKLQNHFNKVDTRLDQIIGLFQEAPEYDEDDYLDDVIYEINNARDKINSIRLNVQAQIAGGIDSLDD